MYYIKSTTSIEFAKELELTAQEMFEKLGYKKYIHEKNNFISYKKELNKSGLYVGAITFDLDEKSYSAHSSWGIFSIKKEDHKAITQQMKELGWL